MSDPQKMTLEQFEHECILFTQEAISFQGSVDFIRKRIPAFFGKLKDFVGSRFLTEASNISNLPASRFKKTFASVDWAELRHKQIMVPPGLNVHFLKYIQTLSKSQDMVDKLLPETLLPFEKFLGTLLASPDAMNSARETRHLDKIVLHDLEGIRRIMAADFSKDAAERRPYGEMIRSNNEWNDILRDYNALSTRALAVPRRQILDDVGIITDHLNTIIKYLEEEPDRYKASGITIKSLAKFAYAMASEVEFYSVQMFSIELLQASLEKAEDAARKK
jgi:hypothetical protein